MDGITISLEDLLPDAAGGILASSGLSSRGVGKTAKELFVSSTRALTKEEVDLVGLVDVGTSKPPTLKSLRDSHHRLAQLIALGIPQVEISQKTGYSQSRISILKSDPSFAQLIEEYRAMKTDVFVDTVAKMKNVTDDALGILQERLEVEPESFSNGALTELVTKIGDRAGFAPVQKSISLAATLDADSILAIKDKVKGRANGQTRQINHQTVEGEFTVLGPRAPADTSGSAGVEVCETMHSPATVLEASKAEGKPGEG